MKLQDVIGSGLVFDRSTATYDIQNSQWIEATYCNISDVRIVYPNINTTGGFDLDNAAAHPALIEVIESTLKDVQVIGWVGSGSDTASGAWLRPILGIYGVTAQAKVDGFEVIQLVEPLGSVPYEWEFDPATYPIEINNATLMRFKWNSSSSGMIPKRRKNALSTSVATSCLIYILDQGVVKDCYIYHDEDGRLLTSIICTDASATGGTIKGNYIKVADPSNGLIVMLSLLGVSVKAGGRIIDNYLECTDTDPTAGLIYQTTTQAIISNNYVKSVTAGAYNSINVSASDDYVVTNNVLKGSGGTAPDVSRNTVKGYADNVRVA